MSDYAYKLKCKRIAHDAYIKFGHLSYFRILEEIIKNNIEMPENVSHIRFAAMIKHAPTMIADDNEADKKFEEWRKKNA